MGYRSSDQISPRIYPWWLILVGFVFGVIVTLVVTHAQPQTVVVYQPENMQDIWLQATQLVHEATMNAQAADRGDVVRPEALDPLLQTATAIVIEATRQAPPE